MISRTKGTTFGSYQRRFWSHFVRDATPWARDNIVWGVVVLIVPPVVVFLQNRTASLDWETIRVTLWLYLVALVVYVAAHLIYTTWKIDQEREQDTAELEKEKDTMHQTATDEITALGARLEKALAAPSGPELWLSLVGNIIGKRVLVVKNIAGGTARNIYVLKMSDGTVTANQSDSIPLLSVGQDAPVRSHAYMTDPAWKTIRFGMDVFLSKVSQPILATIHHEDANGKRFETVFLVTSKNNGLEVEFRQASRKVLL